MTFALWYLSGMVLIVVAEYLDCKNKKKDVKWNIPDILLFFVFSLFGLILIFAIIGILRDNEQVKEFFKKPMINIKLFGKDDE